MVVELLEYIHQDLINAGRIASATSSQRAGLDGAYYCSDLGAALLRGVKDFGYQAGCQLLRLAGANNNIFLTF